MIDSQDMDICSNGWASDGQVYTVRNTYHSRDSGCVTIQHVGAWVYGVKP
jgi:hypothetical protein